jgi:hypothetical protein
VTDDEAVLTVKRIADVPPPPDPLRAALDRYVDDGIVDHHLYRHDGTYHAIVDLIRMALQ